MVPTSPFSTDTELSISQEGILEKLKNSCHFYQNDSKNQSFENIWNLIPELTLKNLFLFSTWSSSNNNPLSNDQDAYKWLMMIINTEIVKHIDLKEKHIKNLLEDLGYYLLDRDEANLSHTIRGLAKSNIITDHSPWPILDARITIKVSISNENIEAKHEYTQKELDEAFEKGLSVGYKRALEIELKENNVIFSRSKSIG